VPFVEQLVFGISATHTVQRLHEYLTVLRAISYDRTVDFHGSQITAVDPSVMPVALAGGTPFPIYVAAMGPRALQVTGELADGTLPAQTGPRTLEGFIAPTITAADSRRRGTAEAVTRRLKTYIDAGATDVALLPLQTDLVDLRRVWDVAAAF
jgi:alkanesulfonate monooxygenase SsuD/methylene tetrahydromethanopterin reductase-like flavin-dependent oxidoreductase (luciferase family)